MAPTDRANSKDKIVNKRNFDHLEDWFKLSSFFWKPVYRVLICVGIQSERQHTVVWLLDLGAVRILVKSSFLQPILCSNVRPVEAPPLSTLRTATNKADSFQGVIFLIGYMRILHACAWLHILENLAVNLLLGTSYMDRSIRVIFPTKRKIAPSNPTGADTHVTTKSYVTPRGGPPRRCNRRLIQRTWGIFLVEHRVL